MYAETVIKIRNLAEHAGESRAEFYARRAELRDYLRKCYPLPEEDIQNLIGDVLSTELHDA